MFCVPSHYLNSNIPPTFGIMGRICLHGPHISLYLSNAAGLLELIFFSLLTKLVKHLLQETECACCDILYDRKSLENSFHKSN